MKKMTKPISLTIAFITILLTLVGCNPFDNGSTAYLTKKMDEIPIECDGYEIGKTTVQDSMIGVEGVYSINGESIEITRNGGEEYVILFKDEVLTINDEFMRINSRVYVEIHAIWLNYYSKSTQDTNASSRIYGVFVYDDNLFIITNGLRNSLSQYDCAWKYPITLYLYDFESESIFYAGYYSDFRKDEVSLKILKKENA